MPAAIAIALSDNADGDVLKGIESGIVAFNDAVAGPHNRRPLILSMHRAEDEARDRGCVGAHLDTYSFQARGFYEKQGHSVFGALPDCPPGHARFFLSKRLDAPPAS